MSGVMQANGLDGTPHKICFPVADVLAGQFVCQGIMAALLEHQRTGNGNHIDVSLLESMLFATSQLSTCALLTGEAPAQPGAFNASIAPYQVFRCQDESIAVGVPNQRIWKRFCDVLSKPEWTTDARFLTNRSRSENRGSLIAQIEPVLRTRTSAEWLKDLEDRQIPCGPLLSAADAFKLPQVIARQTVVEMEHPVAGPLRLVGSPIRFADRQLTYSSPPVLGEHTDEVLGRFADPPGKRDENRNTAGKASSSGQPSKGEQ